MASTLIQIRDLVKANARIMEDPEFTDALLNRWINDAQRSVQLKLFYLGYTEFKSSDSLTLSAAAYASSSNNVKTAPLSTDVPNRMGVPNWLIQIDVNDSGGGGSSYGIAYPVTDRAFKELLSNTFLTPTVPNPICTVLDDKIYLAPVDIDVAVAHYYKLTTDLSSDSDTIDLPEPFVDFVVRMTEMRVEDKKGRLQDKQSKMLEIDKDLADQLKALQIQMTETKPIQTLE